MKLPYESASTGRRALDDIQKTLNGFGCNKFGCMTDNDAHTIIVQFEYRNRPVSVTASINGYAQAWLRRNPYNSYRKCTRDQYNKKATDLAATAVYSILRDWIKGQVTAIETGILSFEGAFLGQLLLPSGRTVLETIEDNGLLRLEKK